MANSQKFLFHSQTNANTDDLSLYMKNVFMKNTRVKMNGKLQSTQSVLKTSLKTNDKDSKISKMNGLTSIIPIITVTPDVGNQDDSFSSIDRSPILDTKFNCTSFIQTLERPQDSFTEESSSEERSMTISTRTNRESSINESDIDIMEHSMSSKTCKKYVYQGTPSNHIDRPSNCYLSSSSSSSTKSDRSSSSISSCNDENPIKSSKTLSNLEGNRHFSAKLFTKLTITNQDPDAKQKDNKTELQTGLFSRIFNSKSSQNLSTSTNKNSRACLIM